MTINVSNSTSNRTECNGDNSLAPFIIGPGLEVIVITLSVLVGSMAGPDVDVDIPAVIMMSIVLEVLVALVSATEAVGDRELVSVANEKTNH